MSEQPWAGHPRLSPVHPAGEEVIGVCDAYRGQSPKAFIERKNGAAGFTTRRNAGKLR